MKFSETLFISMAALLFGLSGCTSLGPPYTPVAQKPNETAVIYVYRPLRFSGGVGTPEILLDGKPVSDVPSGGYFPLFVTPGKHKIEGQGVDYQLGDFTCDVSKNAEYFLRVDLAMNKSSMDTARNVASASTSQVAIAGNSDSDFFADDREIRETARHLDRSAQKDLTNPGFFMVQKDFAQTEIPKTKLYEKK